jgi:type I restriction enzyme S subunit
MVPLRSLFAKQVPSVNPAQFVSERFELWSIPAYDARKPDCVLGSEIGSSKKLVQPNDVLLSRIVPHIRRAWVVAERNHHRQIASGEWIVFRNKEIEPSYLRQVLLSDPFHLQFMQTVAGVGGSLLRARPEGVAEIEIPLPSLDEQRRIAAILDQADGLRHKRRKALDALSRLSKSVFLSLVVTTNTTQRRPLGKIIRVRSGEALTRQHQAIGGRYPVFGGNGINGYHDDYIVEPDTIIVGRVGVYCGAIHLTTQKAWVTDNALIVDIKQLDISPVYLAAAMEHANLNQYAGRSAQPLVSGGRIYPVEVPLPPPDAQRAFTARVAEIETLKARHRAHLAKLDALFASLQHRAFRGEL